MKCWFEAPPIRDQRSYSLQLHPNQHFFIPKECFLFFRKARKSLYFFAFIIFASEGFTSSDAFT